MEREDEEVGGVILLVMILRVGGDKIILTRHGNLSDKLINYPKKYKTMKIC
jgi:hypothetical protein